MKITFIGGMVNNIYIMSKVLKSAGYDITFIRDVEDCFLPHQPVWVDNRIELKSDMLATKTFKDCLDFDKKEGWNEPNWCITPTKEDFIKASPEFKHIKNPILRKLYKRFYHKTVSWQQTLHHLYSADFVIACGVFAAIVARLSGKPYICWAYGADIRKMMQLEPKPKGLKDFFYDQIMIFFLKNAYKNANAVGFNYGEKIYCGGGIHKKNTVLSFKNSTIIPFPAFYYRLNDCKTKISLYKKTKDKIRIFVPSRIDFATKGHDKLLNAIEMMDSLDNFTFTLTGWGKNQQKFIDELQRRNLSQNVIVLDHMYSRPMLYDIINDHDLIIDQFNLGIYGSAALEAMSFGKPVMMYIDDEKSGLNESPPIINCFTKEDILNALIKISEGTVDLGGVGKQCQEWAQKYHGNDVFIKSIVKAMK